MNIDEFKTELCELIDAAYLIAKQEGTREICFPFSVTLVAEDQVHYELIRRHRETATAPVH
jgi:hypothetical protein